MTTATGFPDNGDMEGTVDTSRSPLWTGYIKPVTRRRYLIETCLMLVAAMALGAIATWIVMTRPGSYEPTTQTVWNEPADPFGDIEIPEGWEPAVPAPDIAPDTTGA